VNGQTLTVWAWRTPPGSRKTYYTGHLFADRQQEVRKGVLTPKAKRVHALGNEAWSLYEKGLVTLVQKKIGPMLYDYIAVRVGRRWR
jgi:hypothetical protein